MRKSASMAVVAGLTLAMGGLMAPAAMAKDVVVVVQKGGPFINESGPGDVAYSNVERSKDVEVEQLDKSVETGDLVSKSFGKHNQTYFEVEGTEQDQGEGAQGEEALAEEALAEEAQGEEAQGEEAQGEEAQGEEAQGEEAQGEEI